MQELHIEDDAHDELVELVAVYEHSVDEPDADDRLVGKIEIDGQGYFTVAEAQPAHEEVLQRTVEMLNAKAAITLLSDEPAPEPYSTRLITLVRGDAGFGAGMRKYIETYYGYRFL